MSKFRVHNHGEECAFQTTTQCRLYKALNISTKLSRSARAGTRNFVVFDDKLVSIVRKYGIAGAATIYGVSEADIANALQEGEQ
jgi:hypothetical protein